MSLYTFYFQYKGGSYTSQFKGKTLEKAIRAWAEKEAPTVYAISKKHLKCVQEEIENKYEEPTPVARWNDVPNTTLTPHLGGATREALWEGSQNVLENLRRFFVGEELLTPLR